MNGSYGTSGFGGFGSDDGASRFGGRGGPGFGGAGMGDLLDALGQFKQSVEQGIGASLGSGFGPRAGGRMGRGDVRVAILSLLAEQPMHGYQIIQQIEERSQGAWKPSPGSVYPTLQLLTDEGMVEVEEEGGRKTYSLTEAGRAEAAEKPAPWRGAGAGAGASGDGADGAPGGGGARGDGPGFGALPKAGAGLAQAAMQVGRIGSPEQVQRAVDIIDEARRKLYAILAEG